MSLKITLKVSEETESTDSPWWMIIDPRQNFRVNNQAIHDINGMITGPFFSRKEAQTHLENRHYAFSKNARVYCASGYGSDQYKTAYRNAIDEKRMKKQEESND